jgi:hypothetical protein
MYTPNIEVMCIHQNPDLQMHPANPSPHIPGRFFSVVLSHGTQLDLYFPTMVSYNLETTAAAHGVFDLWFGVGAVLPAGQMLVD